MVAGSVCFAMQLWCCRGRVLSVKLWWLLVVLALRCNAVVGAGQGAAVSACQGAA